MKNLKTLSLAAILLVCSTSIIYLNSCKKDACKNVSCKNGGTCTDGTCNCTTGYTGTDCSTTLVSTFAGTYHGSNYENYAGSTTQSVTVAAGSSVNQITLTGLGIVSYNFGYTVAYNETAINAYVDLNTKAITIPQQLDASGTVSFSGTGALLANNKITLYYNTVNEVTSTGGATYVTFTGTK